jgi:hypothetical protein
MKILFDKHIELIEAVNNSKTEEQHYINMARLDGYRTALEIMQEEYYIECDRYYIDKGVNRIMCCGVFLDWIPTE